MTWGAPRAWAQGASWENEPESDRFVVLEAPASIDPELEETLRELLQRNHFPSGAPRGGARIPSLCAGSCRATPGDATVTITDGSGKSPAVQREVYGSESAAVFRETLAHIILGSVEPLAASRPRPHRKRTKGPRTPFASPATPIAKTEIRRRAIFLFPRPRPRGSLAACRWRWDIGAAHCWSRPTKAQ